jgi:CO dehydrogenase maturation factor
MKISVCGKGGSGKSTVATLLAYAAQRKGHSVLMVDSDESNSGLFRMLGFESPPAPLLELVGGKAQLKERMQQSEVLGQAHISVEDIPADYLRQRDGLMLVSIGKILQALEGCACPMGVLSREFLKKLRLAENAVAIIDMEAGVEHFGRGIDQNIDQILLVVEPSFESVMVAEKIRELAAGIERKVRAVINKASSEELALKIQQELKRRSIPVAGVVPHDPEVFEACLEGRSLDQAAAIDAAAVVLDCLLAEM